MMTRIYLNAGLTVKP